MLNHIVIMGRLTKDPELRYTQSQTPVASFRVACERDYANDRGERAVDFVDCVAWRSSGEFVSKYFQKGSMIIVSGRLQMREWTDRDGVKRISAEIVAESIHFGESKRRDDTPSPSASASNYAAPGPGQFKELDDDDGNLPF